MPETPRPGEQSITALWQVSWLSGRGLTPAFPAASVNNTQTRIQWREGLGSPMTVAGAAPDLNGIPF